MKIEANYKSFFLIVLAPSLIFVILAFGIPGYIYSNYEVSGFLSIAGIMVGSILAGMMASYIVFPLLLKIAGLNKSYLSIEDNLLKWKTGWTRKVIDLTEDYKAEIASGEGFKFKNTSSIRVTDNDDLSIGISLAGSDISSMTEVFQDKDFVDRYCATPAEGNYGFDLIETNPRHKDIFVEILRVLYEQRDFNLAYKMHSIFPWKEKPAPEQRYIKVMDMSKAPDQELVKKLKEKAFLQLNNAFVTKDYVLAYSYSLSESNATYFLAPIGYITLAMAEKLSPQIAFHHKVTDKFLEIQGKDINHNPVAIQFPGENLHEEDRLKQKSLIKFVNSKRFES